MIFIVLLVPFSCAQSLANTLFVAEPIGTTGCHQQAICPEACNGSSPARLVFAHPLVSCSYCLCFANDSWLPQACGSPPGVRPSCSPANRMTAKLYRQVDGNGRIASCPFYACAISNIYNATYCKLCNIDDRELRWHPDERIDYSVMPPRLIDCGGHDDDECVLRELPTPTTASTRSTTTTPSSSAAVSPSVTKFATTTIATTSNSLASVVVSPPSTMRTTATVSTTERLFTAASTTERLFTAASSDVQPSPTTFVNSAAAASSAVVRTSESTATTSSSVGLIVGLSTFALLAMATVIAGGVWWFRRRRISSRGPDMNGRSAREQYPAPCRRLHSYIMLRARLVSCSSQSTFLAALDVCAVAVVLSHVGSSLTRFRCRDRRRAHQVDEHDQDAANKSAVSKRNKPTITVCSRVFSIVKNKIKA
jgi:hypothetical protein